ncbi:Flp family type IVb pilin [Sphingomonas ginkgonis]|uniref:Flp family type IVb pilin n=1 Tax=Sphingomonas ginkgonis TaxID=2315330 RepID=UPI001EF0E85F|nr:Flp family type IVb pilin [Sphingomonas ginkgonis]
MSAIPRMLRSFCADDRGATAIEYGLIASLIVIAIMGGMANLGGGSNGMWTRIQNAVLNSN